MVRVASTNASVGIPLNATDSTEDVFAPPGGGVCCVTDPVWKAHSASTVALGVSAETKHCVTV